MEKRLILVIVVLVLVIGGLAAFLYTNNISGGKESEQPRMMEDKSLFDEGLIEATVVSIPDEQRGDPDLEIRINKIKNAREGPIAPILREGNVVHLIFPIGDTYNFLNINNTSDIIGKTIVVDVYCVVTPYCYAKQSFESIEIKE